MRKILFLSILGTSGLALAAAGQGCSNSSSTPPPASSDSGTVTDTGVFTNPVDTGTPQPGTDSGPVQGADAGPWTPSNFTLTQAGTVTPIAIDENDNCTASTDDGTWSCGGSSVPTAPPFVNVQLPNAGGDATLWVMSTFTLETTNTLTVSGTKPAIFYVIGAVLINAPIVVTAGELTSGVGVGGSGTTGGVATAGGGGGSYCGLGGTGFPIADSGAAVTAPGARYGNATLIPLLAGTSGGVTAYNGASGGGALQITSSTSITIPAGGSILAGGGVDSVANYATNINGSGGGSGGAILLEAPTVAVAGNLSANGSGGADSTDYGTAATIAASPSLGGGTGGGEGSYGGVLTGGNGTGGTGGALAGGGGGGAGYIRINTSNSSAVAGIITPSIAAVDAGCASIGPL